MEERFKTYGYEITTDPQFQNKRYGITPELDKQLEMLSIECQNRKNKKIIDQLTQLVIQYPSVPMLKNYLSVAYNVQGNYKKALEVNKWVLAEHPDYLFAKLNQANVCIDEGDFGKVPEILGHGLELKQLYPERDIFHLAEVTAFSKIVIRYFAAIENLELAENRLEILEKIAPDHSDKEMAELYMMPLRLKIGAERWEKEQAQRITPKQVTSRKYSNKKKAPRFNHPEITNLYQYGLKIPHEKLKEIVELPRQTLIADLEMVMQDSVERYNHFSELEYEEETHSFLLHTLFILNEIKAVESLPKILDLLTSDYEFMDFWLGEHKTETLWQCLYGLGLDNPAVFTPFLKLPGIDTYSKNAISVALCQMVLHHPEKREEIAAIYAEVLTHFSEASLEDNLIDSEFLGLTISDIMDCGLKELLPIIKTLYEKGYVALGICGDYKAVEKEFRSISIRDHKRNIYSIFELYENVLKTWSGYNEEKNDYSASRIIPPQQAKSEKIGRNDPCPCGSGKKYKKCCMK